MAGRPKTRRKKAKQATLRNHQKKADALGIPLSELPEQKPGCPSSYDPKRHPDWGRGLASRGATLKEIALAMDISIDTIYAWGKRHPDFQASIQVGRNETASRIHNSLVRRAEGFSVPVREKRLAHEGGKVVKDETITKSIYFPPDVAAAKLVMINLDKNFKTERTETEIGGTLDKPPVLVGVAVRHEIDPETKEILKGLWRQGKIPIPDQTAY